MSRRRCRPGGGRKRQGPLAGCRSWNFPRATRLCSATRGITVINVNELPPSLDENADPAAPLHNSLKRAIILDQENEAFGVEYDNTIGSRNTMRLEATTYEDAILETKSFLGITENRDET